MAYVTGVVLSTCCLFGFSFWPWSVSKGAAGIMWTAHGYLYMVYLVTAFLLAYRLRWSLTRTLLLLLAGTVPFMSFVAERAVMRQLTREQQLIPSD